MGPRSVLLLLRIAPAKLMRAPASLSVYRVLRVITRTILIWFTRWMTHTTRARTPKYGPCSHRVLWDVQRYGVRRPGRLLSLNGVP